MSIRKSTWEDRERVISILTEAFSTDPHVSWLLEKSRNPDKIRSMMAYLFDETIRIGEVYINQEGTAAALWNSEKTENITIHFLYRNIRFFLQNGFMSVYRILKSGSRIHAFYPKKQSFFHLYAIGVIPEAQGQGFASQLIDPVLERMEDLQLPVFLETANEMNVEIYGRKGFVKVHTLVQGSHKLFIMKRDQKI